MEKSHREQPMVHETSVLELSEFYCTDVCFVVD